MSYFLVLILISLLHFEKPAAIAEDMFSDVIEQSEIAQSADTGDNDGPYHVFVVSVFCISIVSLVLIAVHLRRQLNLYGRSQTAFRLNEELEMQRIKQHQMDTPAATGGPPRIPMMLFGPD